MFLTSIQWLSFGLVCLWIHMLKAYETRGRVYFSMYEFLGEFPWKPSFHRLYFYGNIISKKWHIIIIYRTATVSALSLTSLYTQESYSFWIKSYTFTITLKWKFQEFNACFNPNMDWITCKPYLLVLVRQNSQDVENILQNVSF